ncbi:MAG: peptidylprolyl isomerase [Pyrinomonadaceae bacterium]
MIFRLANMCLWFCLLAALLSGMAVHAKSVPVEDLKAILQAEDELRFDDVLISLLTSDNGSVRERAALAAGRIGDKAALPYLEKLLFSGPPTDAPMAAFAIGEVESIEGADSILRILNENLAPDDVRAAAIEAAGKIAAANANEPKAVELANAILLNLDFENIREGGRDREVVLAGLTAVLRARPKNAEKAIGVFLTDRDPIIRTDAANAITRLGSKSWRDILLGMLRRDSEPTARANAARALGTFPEPDVINELLASAEGDSDSRVRVSALGSLGRLSDKNSGERILKRAETLFAVYRKSKFRRPSETNELLVIASALGSIYKDTPDARAVDFLKRFSAAEKRGSVEIETALARVSPNSYASTPLPPETEWKSLSAIAGGFSAASRSEKISDESKAAIRNRLLERIKAVNSGNEKPGMSFGDVLSAFAGFKSDGFENLIRPSLKSDDEYLRATAASLFETPSAENMASLIEAFNFGAKDKSPDAQLAAIDTASKLYSKLPETGKALPQFEGMLQEAAKSADYLVVRKAIAVARDAGIALDIERESVGFEFPGSGRVVRRDYAKVARRTKARALVTTEKGKFVIELFPRDAPLTVENFISLAKSGYFNGLEIHRVVPNFVVQDGDPRGDGNGGPGWQIRCEINRLSYERGMVGMALSGKDTGGSQWFITHSRQPHLDGGYTIFGRIDDSGMKVVDRLVRRDVIKRIKIIE